MTGDLLELKRESPATGWFLPYVSALLVALQAACISAESVADTGPMPANIVCIACNNPVGEGDIHLHHRGRRVHLHDGMCLAHWEEDRDVLFAQLQARGALFDESAMPTALPSYAWLVFGLYVLAGLLAGAACAYSAISRGRAGLPWFAAGLLLNVLALAAVFTRSRAETSELPEGIPPGMRKVPVTHAPVPCPQCRAANHPAADHCTGCGATLQPTVITEVGRI